MRMTHEREKEIRAWVARGGDLRRAFEMTCDLLAEIDALRKFLRLEMFISRRLEDALQKIAHPVNQWMDINELQRFASEALANKPSMVPSRDENPPRVAGPPDLSSNPR